MFNVYTFYFFLLFNRRGHSFTGGESSHTNGAHKPGRWLSVGTFASKRDYNGNTARNDQSTTELVMYDCFNSNSTKIVCGAGIAQW